MHRSCTPQAHPCRALRVGNLLLGIGLSLVACGGRDRVDGAQSAQELARQVIPQIERAVGLPFTEPPRVEVRSRDQVRAHVDAKIESELPPEELERLTIAYRMFRLIPDTLDMRALMLELYYEQVAGYYEPDSAALFVVEGFDPAVLRLTVSHELVHALQDQYMPLAEILGQKRQNDRQLAAQAVLEGQATLVSVLGMVRGRARTQLDRIWDQARESTREEAARMPVFASAPLVIQEGLLFPYLQGADFMRWFTEQYPDTVPYGPRLPTSTEQILHPDRYRTGDVPIDLRYVEEESAVYSDGLGEFEIRILLRELTGSETTAAAGAMGWAGDRYAVFRTDGTHVLVWWSLWDSEPAANRFARLLTRSWTSDDGRRHLIERIVVDGHPGVLFVDGPVAWDRWSEPPRVAVQQ